MKEKFARRPYLQLYCNGAGNHRALELPSGEGRFPYEEPPHDHDSRSRSVAISRRTAANETGS